VERSGLAWVSYQAGDIKQLMYLGQWFFALALQYVFFVAVYSVKTMYKGAN
jgi:hypothetical protein